jgi:hypothetical protein
MIRDCGRRELSAETHDASRWSGHFALALALGLAA